MNVRDRVCKSLSGLFVLVAIAIAVPGTSADIYKWIGEDGKTYFGDKPPVDASKHKVEIRKSKSPHVMDYDGDPVSPPSQVITMPDGSKRPVPVTDEQIKQHFNDIQAHMLEQKRRRMQKMQEARRAMPNVTLKTRPAANSYLKYPCPIHTGSDCANKDLAKADYSLASISKVSFEGSNLSGAKFKHSRLAINVSFKNADLSNADFTNAVLNKVDFSRADLSGSNFNGMTCAGCTFDNANLAGANMESVDLSSASFRRSNLSGVHFGGGTLFAVDFRGARYDVTRMLGLEEVNSAHNLVYSIDGCDVGLKAADCSDVSLPGHIFRYVYLEGVNFSDADLSAADFTRVNGIKHVNFSGADLSGATFPKGIFSGDFSNADLSHAKLSNINFGRYSKFTGANLEEADLTGSSLGAADFARANLKGANLTGASTNPLAFKNAVLDGCSGCPNSLSQAKIAGTRKQEFDLDTIKAALGEGARFSSSSNPQDVKRLYENLKIANYFRHNYIHMEEHDLREIILVALQSNDAGMIKIGQEVLSKYDDNVNALGRKTICSQPEIIEANRTLINFEVQVESGELSRMRGLDKTTGKEIRIKAIYCIDSAVYRNTDIQKQYIDRFRVEPDPKVKNLLMMGFSQAHSKEVLPFLIDIFKANVDSSASKADQQLSNAGQKLSTEKLTSLLETTRGIGVEDFANTGYLLLSSWDQPPSEVLPLVVAEMKQSSSERGTALISAFGAKAGKYLPTLKNNLGYRKSKHWMDSNYASAIQDIEYLNEIARVNHSLPVDRQRVLEFMGAAFDGIDGLKMKNDADIPQKLANASSVTPGIMSDAGNEVIGKPFFSTNKKNFPGLLNSIAAGNRLDNSRIRAIATVEFEREFAYAYQPPRIGMNTIVFDTPGAAKDAAAILLANLKSRRKLVLGKNVIHLIWWRYGFGVSNSRMIVQGVE